jgi:DNA-binding MarR family transcriptional regulator
MQEENIMKMAAFADTEIKDVPTLNILLCYLLYKIAKPVEAEQLYDIAIGTGVINYFYYQDSLAYLLENGLVKKENGENHTVMYELQPKGRECARQLKTYAPKSYRDKLVLAAMRYFARLKAEQELKIVYEPLENGYYTHVRCLDVDCDLMDLRLYAPDLAQAKLIGEKILLNPAGFYGKVVELALSNEEPPYDLTDN